MRHVPLALMLISATWAQSPAFEVASVKPHLGEVSFSRDPFVRGRRVEGIACTLLDLMTYAYRVRYDEIQGAPKWAGSEHFDIEAKAAGEGVLAEDEARHMMESLLQERFHLAIRRVVEDVPIYALVVGKTGAKLKPADPDATGGTVTLGTTKGTLRMETTKGTIEQLARQLSNTAGRPVLDRTNLAGTFAFTIEWFPGDRIPPAGLDVPTMSEAVQQLGLKLEPTTGAMRKLAVDRVEKPSAN